ncbi:MAG: peptidylprolyl isomerase [Flavobacteriia bacterium]|nr:peptidylprolyl isomerase [Flavobacteriia bacterium]
MAIIGKIREKSGLLLIVVGVAMLAFIMGGWDSMFGSYSDTLGIGTVYGEKVDENKYRAAVDNSMMMDQQQAQQQQKEYTQRDQDNSADRAWSMITEGIYLQKEFDALGIDCSDKELESYLYGLDGFSVLPDLAQNFIDSLTGQFSPRLLEKRIEEMENSSDPKTSQSWANNKLQLKESRKNEKYFQLLSQGLYVTELEAKNEYLAQKEMKNISFVVKRYSEIPDNEIKVNDEMVKKFYEEHKNEKKYESTAGRDVKFFDILIQPSKKDSTNFNLLMAKLKNEFVNTKEDSLFVLSNSDFKFFSSQKGLAFRPENDPKAKKGLTIPLAMDTVFKMANIGDIIGPYDDKGKTRMAKVLDFNTKLCKVRHILLSVPKDDKVKMTEAQKLADSLMKSLNKDNFEEYVKKYSKDPGSVDKGGVYEDFIDGEMVPEFSKFSTTEPIGKIGSVQTDFGVHIIEVLDRKEVKFPLLAVIEKTITASQETETMISDKAHELLYKLDEKISRKSSVMEKLALFDTLAKKEGFFVRPARIFEENPKLNGFETKFAEDKIFKLAYDENAEIGTLCSAPIKDQKRFIIAMVSSIREKGVPKYEDVYDRMKAEVVKERKAKRFITMMLNERNLDKLSKRLNTTVNKAEVTFANPQIPNGGYEPEIVGSLFSGLKNGQVTIPLKGEQGVYVIQLTKSVKAPVASNYNVEKEQLLNSIKAQNDNNAKQALKKLAEVVDNRRFAYLGIKREL